MIHILKIKKVYFDRLIEGEKTAELRKNDRDFQVGDKIHFIEINDNGVQTDRNFLARISHVLTDFEGLSRGWCVLSLGFLQNFEGGKPMTPGCSKCGNFYHDRDDCNQKHE